MTQDGGTPPTHELKTWPKPFAAMRSGAKPFEVRFDDRGFKVGDYLRLREYDMTGYTGEEITVGPITYITRISDWVPDVCEPYVVLGLRAALGRSVPQPDVQELRDEIIRKAAGYRVSDVPMDWDWDDALAADLDRLIAALGGRSVPAEPTPEWAKRMQAPLTEEEMRDFAAISAQQVKQDDPYCRVRGVESIIRQRVRDLLGESEFPRSAALEPPTP